MSLAPGTRLGPYEIVSPLGAGGMGEVYRARDTRLGREVAVKVLPQHLSEQPEIRARFEREARTISTLNHPNICLLFDVGHEGDAFYLVMELIEGDTLADRLLRGPLPANELLRYGTQIADALDRAHRAGIVHRDLKPGNVMLTRGGAKLMDFGLSRMTGLAGGTPGSASAATLTKSPTIAQALTAEGTLLGTFQYMAPEQLEGKEADTRSDIWAFGCVLYEMATGRRAFEGRSQASLIAAILEREPAAVGEVPSGSGVVSPSAPPHGIERLIRNCLAKDPEERIQTAHDVKLQLQNIAEMAGVSGATVVGGSASSIADGAAARRRAAGAGGARLAWSVAAVVAVLAAAGFAWMNSRKTPATPWVRFRVASLPGMAEMFWPRVSPDGRFLVVDASDTTGTLRAYVRPLDQLDLHAIPGTENLRRAYWSPDSKEIAFVADSKLQRVAIGGGSPVVVCAAPGTSDLSWGARGFILLDGTFTDSLRIVPAGGGDFKPATRIDRSAHEIGSAWPCFLPDGDHFLFLGLQVSGTGGNIRLGRLGSLDSKLLGHSDGRVEYAPGDWVLFVRGGTLLAQKLDLGRGALVGEPITLVDDLRIGDAQGHFSVSTNGILAFARTGNGGGRTLVESRRDGTTTRGALATGIVSDPVLSPDGHRLLYVRASNTATGTGEVHMLDLDRSTDTQITTTGDAALNPLWSPDGRRFSYDLHLPSRSVTLQLGSPDGLGARDSIPLSGAPYAMQTQWYAAGSRILFMDPTFRAYSVPTDGSPRTPSALGDSTQFMGHMRISPDGRWLAYVFGTTSSDPHVFVQSFGGSTGRWQISSQPAIQPRWTKGGKELVYEELGGHIVAVPIDPGAGFHAGAPVTLFALPERSFGIANPSWNVSEDGSRFFLVQPPQVREAGVVEVVTDFASLVGRK